MGPFSIDSDSSVNRIQLIKDKYCLAVTFNLNNNGDFLLKIGFDDTIKALEWQDLLEKIKLLNKAKSKSQQRQKTPGERSPTNRENLKQPINIANQNAIKGKGPQGFRQDFFNQAKDFNAIEETKNSDQDIGFNQQDQMRVQDLSPNRQEDKKISQNQQNFLQQQAQTQEQPKVYKIKENTELSFGGNENLKLMFNQSNQSMGQDSIHHPFGLGALTGINHASIDNESQILQNSKLIEIANLSKVTANFGEKLNQQWKPNKNKYQFERTLTPLSEREFSEDEDFAIVNKKNTDQNMFFNLAQENQQRSSLQVKQQNKKSEIEQNLPIQRLPSNKKIEDQTLPVFAKKLSQQSEKTKLNCASKPKQQRKKKEIEGQLLTSENAQNRIQDILNSKLPINQNVIQNSGNLRPYKKILHEYQNQEEISKVIPKANLHYELAPFQLQPIIKMLHTKQSKDLMRIKEDTDSLIYNKNSLRVYLSEDKDTLLKNIKLDNFNRQNLDSPFCFIFKSFYHIDVPVKALLKLYQEPERLKIWDPNVVQTKLLSYLSGNNSKIFSKILKPLQTLTQNSISQKESQMLLINYSSEINKNLFYIVEQSIKDHSYMNKNDAEQYMPVIVPINIIIAKQKSLNKTEIKQYYCVNVQSLVYNQQNSITNLILSPLNSCGALCRGSALKKQNQLKQELHQQILKNLKFHFEGMRNYITSISDQQRVKAKSKSRDRKMKNKKSIEVKHLGGKCKKQNLDKDKNKYAENQDFLNKLLTQSQDVKEIVQVTKQEQKKQSQENKFSPIQQVFSGQQEKTDSDLRQSIIRQDIQKKTLSQKSEEKNNKDRDPFENIFKQKPIDQDLFQNPFKQQRKIVEPPLERLENIDTYDLGISHNKQNIREQARDIKRSQSPTQIHIKGSTYTRMRSFSPTNESAKGYSDNEKKEEKGLVHYRKSGIAQRNLNENPQYQRKPSPVTEKRKQQFRRQQIKQQSINLAKRQNRLFTNEFIMKHSTPQFQQDETDNSIVKLLDQSFEEINNKKSQQQQHVIKNNHQQEIQQMHKAWLNHNQQHFIEDKESFVENEFLNNESNETGPKNVQVQEVIFDNNQNYEGDSDPDLEDNSFTSDDSDYDFEQEASDAQLKRGQINTFFEENDFKRDDKHGLIFTNEELMKKQRGVMSHFIKQMGFNVIHGKSILQVCLPIKVFDSKSFLEKIAMFFKMAPLYLEKAAAIPQLTFSQALQRFKFVVAFAVSTRHYTAQMRKPFNPILGETFEARVGHYKIALEQICHHPPVTYYSMSSKTNDKFQAYGSLEYRPVLGANSAGGFGYGPFIIEFNDGHKIEIWSPKTEITGLMYGERAFNIYDSMIIKDKRNGIYSEIVFNPEKKSGIKGFFGFGSSGSNQHHNSDEKRADYIEGVISTNETIDYKKNRNKLVQGDDYICMINGHWTEDLYIDGVKYWHINEHKGFRIRPVKNPLPSDCRFREDLVHLINTDEDTAQKWKEILESRQRNDRKLREECEKRRKRLKR